MQFLILQMLLNSIKFLNQCGLHLENKKNVEVNLELKVIKVVKSN